MKIGAAGDEQIVLPAEGEQLLLVFPGVARMVDLDAVDEAAGSQTADQHHRAVDARMSKNGNSVRLLDRLQNLL